MWRPYKSMYNLAEYSWRMYHVARDTNPAGAHWHFCAAMNYFCEAYQLWQDDNWSID